jgi:hypothetical protein
MRLRSEKSGLDLFHALLTYLRDIRPTVVLTGIFSYLVQSWKGCFKTSTTYSIQELMSLYSGIQMA